MKQVILFSSYYLYNIDLLLWWCFAHDGAIISRWLTMHSAQIFIINFIPDPVCLHVYPPTDIFFVFFSFCCLSMIYFLAVWHSHVVATYYTICTHHLSATWISGGTNKDTFLCHCTFVYVVIHDEIWWICVISILPGGNNDSTMSTKSIQVFFNPWGSDELLRLS
jgi:hypothetical protein